METKIKKNIILKLFRFVLLFEILWGAHAWFTWWIDDNKIYKLAIYAIIAFIAFIYKKKANIHFRGNAYIILGSMAYIMAFTLISSFSFSSLITSIVCLYPILVTIYDRNNCEGHIAFITKGLAYILVPSIILYIVSTYYLIPGFIIANSSSEKYLFINNIFLLQRLYIENIAENRFHSIFLEPGYLGTMLSFILYANNYNFKKKYNYIILISLIATVSLAGYIITFIGYITYLISTWKNLKKIFVFSIFIICTYFVAINHNQGDNIINKGIIERLQYDEEKGISGNNRTGAGTDFYYNQAMKNGDIWFGLGAERVRQINGGSSDTAGYEENIRGAGYKVFFVKNGIISAIIFLFFYILFANNKKGHRMYKMGFVFIIILTFIQAAYPLSASWIYPFVLGINNINNPKTPI